LTDRERSTIIERTFDRLATEISGDGQRVTSSPGVRGRILWPRGVGSTYAACLVSERREHGRLPVQIPVVLRGTDSAGRVFFDRAQIVSIDERGARVHTRFHLKQGSEVKIELPGEESQKLLRVVWSGEPGSFYDGMVGLEFVAHDDTWNLENLRSRWGARNY
jgi:hypothetical protein